MRAGHQQPLAGVERKPPHLSPAGVGAGNWLVTCAKKKLFFAQHECSMQSAASISEPSAVQLELSRLPSDEDDGSTNAVPASPALSPINALPDVAAIQMGGPFSKRPGQTQSSRSQLLKTADTRGEGELYDLENFNNWMLMKGAADPRPAIPWNLYAFFICLKDHLLFPFNIPYLWFFCGASGRHLLHNSQWIPAWSDWIPSFKNPGAMLFLPITPFIILIRIALPAILVIQFIDPRVTGRRIDIRYELAFTLCCVFCWILTVSAKHATTPPILYDMWRTTDLPAIVVTDEQLLSSWLTPDTYRQLRELQLCASRAGREGLLRASMLLPSCHPLAMSVPVLSFGSLFMCVNPIMQVC
jgi:hypothetical protein